VDVRYSFPLGGTTVALVGFSNRDGGSIGVYKVDPAARRVVDIQAGPIKPGIESYGFCLYRSQASGKYYAFVTDKKGALEQWELFDDGKGKVDGTRVRRITIGSQSEGCVADDTYAALYVAEEDVGIWKYGAEPGDGSARTLVDSVSGPHLAADVEGLTIYYASRGTGYLIASSQGSKQFAVYERAGANAHVMNFRIVAGNGIDGLSDTDGIDVTNFPLGSAFPEGVFVAQDGTNTGGNQNFKLVPWGAIARGASPNLAIDRTWDPRPSAATPPIDRGRRARR
jgi:3-phytase